MQIAHHKEIDVSVLVVKVTLDLLQTVDQNVSPIKTVHQIKLAVSTNADQFVAKGFVLQQPSVVQLITLQSAPVLKVLLEIHFTAVNIFLLPHQKGRILVIQVLAVRVRIAEISVVLEVVNVLKTILETPTPVVDQNVRMTTIAPVRNHVKIQSAWIHALEFVVLMLSVMYDSTFQFAHVILATKEIHFQHVTAFRNHHQNRKEYKILVYRHLVDHTVKVEVLAQHVNALALLATLGPHQTADLNVQLTRNVHWTKLVPNKSVLIPVFRIRALQMQNVEFVITRQSARVLLVNKEIHSFGATQLSRTYLGNLSEILVYHPHVEIMQLPQDLETGAVALAVQITKAALHSAERNVWSTQIVLVAWLVVK